MKADSGTWHIQNLYLWDPVWGTCIHHFRNPCPSTEQSPGLKLPVPKRVILLIKCGFDREEGEETRKPRRAVMYAGLKHTEDSSHPGTKVSDTMDGLVSWIAKDHCLELYHGTISGWGKRENRIQIILEVEWPWMIFFKVMSLAFSKEMMKYLSEGMLLQFISTLLSPANPIILVRGKKANK
ncbi:uncharacterized protein LOC144613236 isoform X2 [Panthera onca]